MPDSSAATIAPLQAEEARAALPELIHLLQDTVDSGASVGFLPPLGAEEASAYWLDILPEIAAGSRILLVARQEGRIVGSVQLALSLRSNAPHRAEVQKLFVLRTQRRQGTGRALMQAIEEAARTHQRPLLVLDTRPGDNAEQLYRQLGYTEAGIIPNYVLNSAGQFESTIYFYKIL